ncbi:MAG: hypothetical protein HYT11_01220 [Candidatus Levybacteria bacterium]|nr:hypothetical protein [Candidatus Levybacteria bacterium]
MGIQESEKSPFLQTLEQVTRSHAHPPQHLRDGSLAIDIEAFFEAQNAREDEKKKKKREFFGSGALTSSWLAEGTIHSKNPFRGSFENTQREYYGVSDIDR